MVIVDGIVFSLQKYGGISVYQYELLKRLAVDDIEYKLILPDATISKLESEIVDVCSNMLYFNARFLERYRDCLIDVRSQKQDVFHSSYYRNPSVKNINKVVTVHDFTYEYYTKGFKRHVHIHQKYSAIKKADKIICISDNTKSDLAYFLGDAIADKSTVIHNGVSSDYFPIDGVRKKPQVVFVGAESSYKGFYESILALTPIQDFNFIIVGGGTLKKNELDFLESNLSGRYTHFPFLNNMELNKVYNESLCLLYPSLYEGFGIPPLEAMKAGCIPCVRNTSSLPEVVGNAGLIAYTSDVAELTMLLYTLFDSEFLRVKISEGFLQSRKFSWDNCYSLTKNIYTSF